MNIFVYSLVEIWRIMKAFFDCLHVVPAWGWLVIAAICLIAGATIWFMGYYYGQDVMEARYNEALAEMAAKRR
jgi:type II secretory pathway component PulF